MHTLVNFFDAVECQLKENPSYFYLNSSLFTPLMDPRAQNRISVISEALMIFT